MGCNCNSPINSWIDWLETTPQDPLDLIAYATLEGVAGVRSNSSVFINNGATYAANTWSIASAPTCEALETDNLQMVADATQWNMQHLTTSSASFLAPPLSRVIFLRGGTQWRMKIPIAITGTASHTVFELSFRDNAGTRGDAQGTVPVIGFPGLSVGNVTAMLIVTLHPFFKRAVMGLRATNGDVPGASEFYESEWNIVP